MRLRGLLLAAGILLATGCGSDSTGPNGGSEPTYENIADTYVGVLAGNAQGIVLEASFSITIQQSAGDLTGSWSMTGTLNDGVIIVPIQGTGSLTGTINSGQNPSLSITTRSATCPNLESSFSGSYDSVNRIITISGPIQIVDDCVPVITYQSTIVLGR